MPFLLQDGVRGPNVYLTPFAQCDAAPRPAPLPHPARSCVRDRFATHLATSPASRAERAPQTAAAMRSRNAEEGERSGQRATHSRRGSGVIRVTSFVTTSRRCAAGSPTTMIALEDQQSDCTALSGLRRRCGNARRRDRLWRLVAGRSGHASTANAGRRATGDPRGKSGRTADGALGTGRPLAAGRLLVALSGRSR